MMSRTSYVVLLAAIAACAVVHAQETKLYTFRTDTGIHIRWIGNTDPSVTGWVVERSVDGGAFIRLTPEPLSIITSYTEMKRRVGRYLAMYFLKLFGVDAERDLTPQDVLRALNSPQVSLHLAFRAASPELAQLSGEYYFDRMPIGNTCRYRVIPLRESTERPAIESPTIDVDQLDRLPPPGAMIGMGKSGYAQLQWPRSNSTKSDEIVGFRVWKGALAFGPFEEVTLQTSVPIFSRPDNISTYNWSDDLVNNGDTVYYYVRHVHATGELSTRSEVVRIVVGADDTPSIAQQLSVKRFGHAARLSWNWPSFGSLPQRVELHRVNDGTAEQRIFMLLPGDTSFIDAMAEMGNVYRYAIITFSNTDSASSDTVSFSLTDVVAPKAPQLVRATPDTAKIHLSWSRSASTDVAGYIVMMASDPKLRTYLRLRSELITDTVFTDTLQQEAEGPFAYVIVAEDLVGNTSAPSNPVIAKPIDVSEPAPSQFVEFRRKGQHVYMRYSASASADVSSYMVQRQMDSSAWMIISATTILEARDSVSAPGVYRYRVIVVDSANNSSEPSQTRSITVLPELEAPALLTVQRDTFALVLEWSSVDGAAGYEIARVDVQTGERIVMDNVGANETRWSDGFSDADRIWRYEVSARTANWRMGPHRYVVYQP